LQRADAEHQICRAGSEHISTLDDWAKEIRLASREIANGVQLEPEFEAHGPVRNPK
jgi:hypothetical protein